MRVLAGAAPAAAGRARAELVFSSLGARVTEPWRDGKYDTARVRIANAALIPSRVWRDTSTWTSTSTSRRTLLIGGRFTAQRYRLETAQTVATPTEPAESRHVINLTHLSGDAYAWDTEVLYAIGTASSGEIAAFTRALFAAAESRAERDVRADFAAVMPRTTAAMGQLFTLDSIHTSRLPDSSTIATFMVTTTPDGVQKKYPHFRNYVRKYIAPTRMRWSLTDNEGANFLDLWVTNSRLLLRVRTRGGRMVSLASPARPMPDSLTLNGEMTMKVKGITAGIRDYHAEFTVIRTDREAAWSLVSRREPQWVLPLATARLLRTPLRRPFQGNGSMFAIGVRDSVGGQTMLVRRLHLEVEESAILRFVGRLGATAVGDYRGDAERDQLAWLREVFQALAEDVRTAGS